MSAVPERLGRSLFGEWGDTASPGRRMRSRRCPGDTRVMAPVHTFAYPPCPIRSWAKAAVRLLPVIGEVAATFWPAARRADRVVLSGRGIDAWSLAGYTSIDWDDVAAVHRARTTWGRMTLHVVAEAPLRQIEVAETIPGFGELVAEVTAAAGGGQVISLRAPELRRQAA